MLSRAGARDAGMGRKREPGCAWVASSCRVTPLLATTRSGTTRVSSLLRVAAVLHLVRDPDARVGAPVLLDEIESEIERRRHAAGRHDTPLVDHPPIRDD